MQLKLFTQFFSVNLINHFKLFQYIFWLLVMLLAIYYHFSIFIFQSEDLFITFMKLLKTSFENYIAYTLRCGRCTETFIEMLALQVQKLHCK
jgi:hypothetical protein